MTDTPDPRPATCGKPHMRTPAMTTEPGPNPRPVGETALSAAEAERDVVLAMYDYKQAAESGAVLAAAQLYSDLFSAIRRYGTTIKAEARAALLAGAPEVWVATDETGTSRIFSAPPATIAVTLQPFWGGEVSSALTPPGACIRYRLVPDPGDTSEAAFRDALHLPETDHVDLVRRRDKEGACGDGRET